MPDYTLAVGTHDPQGFAASSDRDAIQQAVSLIELRYLDDLTARSQDVVTLMGAQGLLTRPSERLDHSLERGRRHRRRRADVRRHGLLR